MKFPTTTTRAVLLAGTAALLLAALAPLPGCNGPDTPTDNPTSGTVGVAVDATFAPILQAQVDTFGKLYPDAHVRLRFAPEDSTMLDLLNDQVKVAVVSRPLNAEETAVLSKQEMLPKTTAIGLDGLAIILHPSNPDSLLTVAQLRDIFTGRTRQWSAVSGQKKLGDITVIFDANRSSTARFVRDSLTRGAALSPRATASTSNPALLDYVAAHPGAIGVVGVNWISDHDDPKALSFVRKVRVAAITARPNPKPDDFIQPYQAYLAEKTPQQLAAHPDLQNYPLRRTIYMISREARTGLGTGFVSFVAGTKGQLIFQKSGLIPAQMQARIITTPKLH